AEPAHPNRPAPRGRRGMRDWQLPPELGDRPSPACGRRLLLGRTGRAEPALAGRAVRPGQRGVRARYLAGAVPQGGRAAHRVITAWTERSRRTQDYISKRLADGFARMFSGVAHPPPWLAAFRNRTFFYFLLVEKCPVAEYTSEVDEQTMPKVQCFEI